MNKNQIVIPRVWHSQIPRLCVFFVLCITCIVVSKKYPGPLIIGGNIVTIGSYRFMLDLPLLFLLPATSLARMILRIYDVRYVVDGRGIEAKIGTISLNQRIMRIRYEDIRSIEVSQNVLDRILDVGRVDISTAASSGIELYFSDITAPKEVQDWLQLESDRRQRKIHIKDQGKTLLDMSND